MSGLGRGMRPTECRSNYYYNINNSTDTLTLWRSRACQSAQPVTATPLETYSSVYKAQFAAAVGRRIIQYTMYVYTSLIYLTTTFGLSRLQSVCW